MQEHTIVRLVALAVGAFFVGTVLLDAFETIILPRRASGRFRLTRLFYVVTWRPWGAISDTIHDNKRQEVFLSFYGPLSLLMLLLVWATLLVLGFGLVYYSLGSPVSGPTSPPGLATDIYVSGTTLFTLGLGDVVPTRVVGRVLLIMESGLGFGFLAVVIGYLPVLYGAFSRREVDIALLDSRAGSPPSGMELLKRHSYPGGEQDLAVLLEQWERWAAELLESHISYPILCYFRSQHDNQSWVSALVAILDASSLLLAGIEGQCARQAQLTYAIGRHALVDIAQVFGVRPEIAAGSERLHKGEYIVIAKKLCLTGLVLDRSEAAEARLTELRGLYEGYALGMSKFLRMPVDGWLVERERKDNWQKVARISGVDKAQQETNPFQEAAGGVDDDHL
jgi:hypothetical protein